MGDVSPQALSAVTSGTQSASSMGAVISPSCSPSIGVETNAGFTTPLVASFPSPTFCTTSGVGFSTNAAPIDGSSTVISAS